MATTLKVETTSADSTFKLVSGDAGQVFVFLTHGSEQIAETTLIETVLEYAHARGLRRQRKPKDTAKPRRRRASNGAAETAQPEPPAAV